MFKGEKSLVWLVELALWVGKHDHHVACIPFSYSEFGSPCLQEFVAKMLVFPMFNYRDSRSSTYEREVPKTPMVRFTGSSVIWGDPCFIPMNGDAPRIQKKGS